MVLALFGAALLLLLHVCLSVGFWLYADREIDWWIEVFGALFFAVCAAGFGREALSVPVATRSALRIRDAVEIRGRLTPRLFLVVAGAIVLTPVSAILTLGVALAPLGFDVGTRDEVLGALLMAGFVLIFNAVLAGYAVGLLRASRIVLISLSPDGVSVATSGGAPALTPWNEVEWFSRSVESTSFPIGPGDVDHHFTWRFGDVSVRTPVDLRPDVVEIDRELRRLAPHLAER
ncbi:hypothetical protein TPB0596_24250 [Tsukamurella pulmonis]|uniref:hypothetical protein n=1 Tax=Tsukamurella pulmonis TaxID=47312 RepID=UPI0007937B68|nr:hypothetical protein [Tsukamurella pulmonis]KXP09396.1 hypothetical protein AXK57_10885 [Tsukamurella pulmonis]RDH09255.1 hypothetical protein DVB88_24070 [Tsukamurella pulmonis]BDD82662.1 hypothetical protein TPB0596_24250 [Tsukamurella pulmonis]